jgi:hypothetical protein
MDAPAPQGDGRGGGGRREGGAKPRTRHAAGPEALRQRGSAASARVVRQGSPWEEASSDEPASVGGTVRERCDGPLEESESTWGAPVRLRPAREVLVRESPVGVKTPCGPEGTDVPPGGSGSASPGCRATPEEGRRDAVTRLGGSHCSSSLRRAATDCRRLQRQVLLGPVPAQADAGPLTSSDVWMR